MAGRHSATPPPGAKHSLVQHVDETADYEALMSTTHQMSFKGSSPSSDHRRKPRPTSNTRHNNPQSQSFKTAVLPSGQKVNVSLHTSLDGHGGIPVGSGNVAQDDLDFKPDSTFRQSFKKPDPEGWQKGNVARYGHKDSPWAKTHAPSVGIVPSVNHVDLHVTTTTNPTTRDTFATGTQFGSRFSSTSSRRAPTTMDSTSESQLRNIVTPEAVDAVSAWIKSAPGFEGEVVKRMLQSVTRAMTPEVTGSTEPLEGTSPVQQSTSPTVSKWGAPTTYAV
eukprot:m.355977 g.355977  ORF g.355977 m.355977 type:complete len:278 (+) comp17399_c0_seq1:444-1277(+)